MLFLGFLALALGSPQAGLHGAKASVDAGLHTRSPVLRSKRQPEFLTTAPRLTRRGGNLDSLRDDEEIPFLPSHQGIERHRLALDIFRRQKLLEESPRPTHEKDLRTDWCDRCFIREYSEHKLQHARDRLANFDDRVAKQNQMSNRDLSGRQRAGVGRPGSPFPKEDRHSSVAEARSEKPGLNSRAVRGLQAKDIQELRSVLRDLVRHPQRTGADARRRLTFTPVAGEMVEALRRNGESPARAHQITSILAGRPFRGNNGFQMAQERNWRLRLNLPPFRPGRIE